MSTRLLVLVGVVGALTGAAPAVAAPAGSVTATGIKLVKVRPADRQSSSSIAAAVNAAEKAGISGALASARGNAVRYAQAAGLTLGTIISISDAQQHRRLLLLRSLRGGRFLRPLWSQSVLRH